MLIKSYTANAYRGGRVIGSVTGTYWFTKLAIRAVPEMRQAAKEAYGDDVTIADFRRV